MVLSIIRSSSGLGPYHYDIFVDGKQKYRGCADNPRFGRCSLFSEAGAVLLMTPDEREEAPACPPFLAQKDFDSSSPVYDSGENCVGALAVPAADPIGTAESQSNNTRLVSPCCKDSDSFRILACGKIVHGYEYTKRYKHLMLYCDDCQIGLMRRKANDIDPYSEEYELYLLEEYGFLADWLALFMVCYDSRRFFRNVFHYHESMYSWQVGSPGKQYYDAGWLYRNFKVGKPALSGREKAMIWCAILIPAAVGGIWLAIGIYNGLFF